jgi:hypothetical protein
MRFAFWGKHSGLTKTLPGKDLQHLEFDRIVGGCDGFRIFYDAKKRRRERF